METRYMKENYADIAHDLIQHDNALEDIKNSDVTIIYLASDLEKRTKRKLVYAECEKVPDRFKWSVPCDFTITVFEPNVERLNEEQIRILLLHELLHVGIERDGNEERYFVRPHDIEDFDEIIKRYGTEWADDNQT